MKLLYLLFGLTDQKNASAAKQTQKIELFVTM